jgi:putative metalloprotease
MTLILLVGCDIKKADIPAGISGGQDVVKGATLTDDEVRSMAQQVASYEDERNKIAPPDSPYAIRLQKLMASNATEGGMPFNFKVYMTSDVNAFALADGSVRVFSGLMDTMTDDEVRFVLGHEIGHVIRGHMKKKMQVAYGASALRKGAQARGGVVGQLAASELGDLAQKLINAQFSQDEERDADDYGLQFLKANRYNAGASITALQKLEKAGGGSGGGVNSFFASHPAPASRAARLQSKL